MEPGIKTAVEQETFASRRAFFVFVGILALLLTLVGYLSWPLA